MFVLKSSTEQHANPAANIEVTLLVQLVSRAKSLNLTLDIDRSGTPRFALLDNSSHIQRTFTDAAELTGHLDSLNPQDVRTDIQISESPFAFTPARHALHLKTGYSNLDCAKALRSANGDIHRALARLIETKGYAAYKV